MLSSENKNNSYFNIKNIILDWGGVITDIDYKQCIEEFQKLGIRDFKNQYSLLIQSDLYRNFETGIISPKKFRQGIRKLSDKKITDQQIDDAWKSMLLDIPEDRWKLLNEIKKNYRMFVLSNTNILHVKWYFSIINEKFGTYGYSHLFEKIYYSYRIGLRKPDMEIYKYVIEDCNINPSETLFIDDSHLNLKPAKKLGIQTYHLQSPKTLIDLFDNRNLLL